MFMPAAKTLYSLVSSSAQAPAQLRWAELAYLHLTKPASQPPDWNSSAIAGNQPNSFFNICRSTPVDVIATSREEEDLSLPDQGRPGTSYDSSPKGCRGKLEA